METIAVAQDNFTGLVLAGGEARRMGGKDKGLIRLAGRPMVQFVLVSLSRQVGHVIISANRHRQDYTRFGYPVIADDSQGFCGPLAGMASGLKAAQTPFLVTVPCDSPFVPDDLVQRLYAGLLQADAEISVAHDGDRMHPVFALMKTTLRDSIVAFLENGDRKIDKWFMQHKLAITNFSDKPETFMNINTPDDLALIEARLVEKI